MGFRSSGGGLGGTGLLPGPASGSIDLGDDSEQGISGRLALSDHEHPFPGPNAAPLDLAAASAIGDATRPAAQNHVHRHRALDHLGGGFADLTGALSVIGHVHGALAGYDTQGLLAARPAAGNVGATYFATDVGAAGAWYRDDGAAWVRLTESYLPVNVRNHCDGDGIADDTAGLAAAFADAAAGVLYLAAGTYNTTTEVLYDAAASGPIRVFGPGVIRLTGAANKGVHVTGVAGVTRAHVILDGLQVFSATAGTSPAAIHLDGIADYQIHDVIVGPFAKVDVGVLFTGAQQGEWSGGFIEAQVGGAFELSGLVGSNGCDMHGVSLNCAVAGVTLEDVDSAFIHANHMTGAPVGIDVISSGFGILDIVSNHIEQALTASIRLAVDTNQTFIAGNSCFSAGGVDLIVAGGTGHTIIGNLFNGDVALAGDRPTFIGNHVLAGFVDTSTNPTILGNHGNAEGVKMSRDRITIVSGNGAIGSTGNLYVDAGGGGSVLMRVAGFGPGFLLGGDNIIDIAGAATTTDGPPAGAADALPATPLGYLRIRLGGTIRRIPFYEDA